MKTYERPQIEPPVFTDDTGQAISYGHRWEEEPPEDSYSKTSNTERFDPIVHVAEAMIAYLISKYDVTVTEHSPHEATPEDPENVVKALTLTPSNPQSAPLKFEFTDFPGIRLHAGLMHVFLFPACGCDACDEDWTTCIDEFEEDVLAVVEGNYQEYVEGTLKLWQGYHLTTSNGSYRGGRGWATKEARQRAKHSRKMLEGFGGKWRPWPLRT